MAEQCLLLEPVKVLTKMMQEDFCRLVQTFGFYSEVYVTVVKKSTKIMMNARRMKQKSMFVSSVEKEGIPKEMLVCLGRYTS